MLKKALILLNIALAVLSCGADNAGSGILTKAAVSPKFVSLPALGGYSSDASRKWIAISVDFTLRKNETKGNPNGYQFCDEIEIDYEALINEPGVNKVYYLTGKSILSDVEFDGLKKFTEAYISPQTVNKIKSRKTPFDKKYYNNILIRITFIINGNRVMQAYYPEKEDTGSLFNNALNNINVDKIKDSIIGRNKTPWAVLNTDRFEIDK